MAVFLVLGGTARRAGGCTAHDEGPARPSIHSKTPQNFVDNRFSITKNNRSFRCDDCLGNWGGGDGRVGDWLYDQNNRERFRAGNIEREAVHSGRAGQRFTFRFRDGGAVPAATAPIDFPRFALN